jgi:hypothetical protein
MPSLGAEAQAERTTNSTPHGHPVDTGTARDESEYDVSRWDFETIFGRLSRFGADDELIELTRQCLAFEREDRPRQAGVVAARISKYLSGVRDQKPGNNSGSKSTCRSVVS